MNRERLHGMKTIVQEPHVYLVPRNGTIESVTVTDHDDLRRLRTELEILRRIARNVSSMRLIPPRQNAENRDLHRELFNALKDAAHPVIEEAVTLIDSQNPELRKELFMSVVNEEAENIVQEAIENGVAVADQTATSAPTQTHPTTDLPDDASGDSQPASDKPEMPVAEALAQAQEELARAVQSAGADQATEPPGDEATNEPAAKEEPDEKIAEADIDEPQTATVESEQPTETDVPQPSTDESNQDHPTADIETQLDECLSSSDHNANASDHNTTNPDPDPDPNLDSDHDPITNKLVETTPDKHQPIGQQPIEPQSIGEPVESHFVEQNDPSPQSVPEPSAATEQSAFTDYTADKATAAVEEIERGIRKLADLLSNDVNTQWKQAQDAFVEVLEARTKAGTLHQDAMRMAREIARLKEEIEIARDDADIARREAKLMREDTLLAKRRTEDLANAAKQCA